MPENKLIKELFPLALDTIKRPVKYDEYGGGYIWDSEGMMVCDIRGWGKISKMEDAEERQDQIGEMIAHLINNAE